MSETEFKPFFVDRAKGGRANCKGCKGNCPSGELRIAKLMPSPYGENQTMKSWHHVDCFMNGLLKQRPTTKRVDSIDDIGNWESLSRDDQEFLLKKLNETEKLYEQKHSGKYTAKVLKNESQSKVKSSPVSKESKNVSNIEAIIDNKFSTFCTLCKKISSVDAYTDKTATVNNFFRKGTKDVFKGDLALWCKLLLPQVTKRVYNLKSKQLVKVFSKIFNTDHDDMLTHLEQGDVAETLQYFFKKAKTVKPSVESTLTIHNIEDFLEELSKLTKEEEQIYHFKKIVKKCTEDDLKMLIRLIKCDLRIHAGPKHILEGVHPDAYTAFQTSRDLDMVLDRVLPNSTGVKHKDMNQESVAAKLSLMTPVLPMLAEACKSVDMAMKKCPNGMYSEIKYDGERVQVHKKGNEFKYFSRALKPVMSHKVSHFKDYLPQAFPKGVDMILDAEVLMVDVNTGQPLPFGTLGIHKQSEFKDAQVCLYVFDCLYYNGTVLIDMPIKKRREILCENMVEVKNHVMFSEQELIVKPADLAKMIAKVLQLGLEGLVLKDLKSTYEPGKRHWLKVKKDYLFDGAMADTADLVVLGAWFGTGKKGGMMSVFLMGCLDRRRNKWVTVTKVHTGHDDATLKRLQKELNPLMVKISQDYNRVPSWLDCNKGMVPDFVAKDPKELPVWEITGTELTKANLHTADGISVRFPRVTRIREDKSWEEANDLEHLKRLYKTSKEKTDVSLLTKLAATAERDEPPTKKLKNSPGTPKKLDSKDSIRKNTASPKTQNTLDNFIRVKDSKKHNSSTNKINLSETSDDSEHSLSKRKLKREDTSESVENSFIVKNNDPDSDENDSYERHSEVSKVSKKKINKVEDTKSQPFEDNQESDCKKENKSESKSKKYKETSSSFKSRENLDKFESVSSVKDSRRESKNKSYISGENSQSFESESSEISTKKSKKRKYKEEENSRSFDNEEGGDIDESISTNSNESTSKKKKRKLTNDSKSNSIENLDERVVYETEPIKREIISKEKEKSTAQCQDTVEIDEDESEIQLFPENPLPDAFTNKRLGFYPDFISFTEEERSHFERHWIAYGGFIVKAVRSFDVDYLVHNKEVIDFRTMKELTKKVPPNVRHVNKYWVMKCINDVTLHDTAKYAVIVEP